MKILCICQRGNSRSVALSWILKDQLGHEALAIGLNTTSEETKDMLYKWADKIILVDKRFVNQIPENYNSKLFVFDVGFDRFFRGYDPELLEMYYSYIERSQL